MRRTPAACTAHTGTFSPTHVRGSRGAACSLETPQAEHCPPWGATAGSPTGTEAVVRHGACWPTDQGREWLRMKSVRLAAQCDTRRSADTETPRRLGRGPALLRGARVSSSRDGAAGPSGLLARAGPWWPGGASPSLYPSALCPPRSPHPIKLPGASRQPPRWQVGAVRPRVELRHWSAGRLGLGSLTCQTGPLTPTLPTRLQW